MQIKSNERNHIEKDNEPVCLNEEIETRDYNFDEYDDNGDGNFHFLIDNKVLPGVHIMGKDEMR
jgi:hypothetical protein